MASPPRALRIIILLLAFASCASLIYDRRVYTIDRFNGYLSFALMGSYVFSLTCQYTLVNKYTRAFLMIFLAFVWVTVNTSWTWIRYVHEREFFRADVGVSFPTSILVVVEVILTLRYEAWRKKEGMMTMMVQDQESGNNNNNDPSLFNQQQYPPAYRQMQEMSTVGTAVVGVLPPVVLPQDEQDNIEITISPIDTTPVSSLSRATGHGYRQEQGQGQGKTEFEEQQYQHQIPARAYFPPSASSSLSSSTSSSSSSSQSRRNRERTTRDIPGGPAEDLPPYSHV